MQKTTAICKISQIPPVRAWKELNAQMFKATINLEMSSFLYTLIASVRLPNDQIVKNIK